MMRFLTNGIRKMYNKAALLRIMHEKGLLEKNYNRSFVHCELVSQDNTHKLVCHVHYILMGENIHFRIVYDGRLHPKAWIVSPKIIDPQHIYSDDKSLCLYDPKTDEWSSEKNIYNTFIPWCQQWIVFQRLYEQTGRWQHPERHPVAEVEKN